MDTVKSEKKEWKREPKWHTQRIKQTTLKIKISTFYDQKWVYNCGVQTHSLSHTHTHTHSAKEKIYAVVGIQVFPLRHGNSIRLSNNRLCVTFFLHVL